MFTQNPGMAASLLACPLCSQPGFTSLESLRDGLIGAATRQIVCPVCNDILHGIDKFTIHLFSHFLQYNIQSIVSSAHKFTDLPKCNVINNPVNLSKPRETPNLSKPFEQFQVSCNQQQSSIVHSNQLINIGSVQNSQIPLNTPLIQPQQSNNNNVQLNTTLVHPQQLSKITKKTKTGVLRSISSFNDKAISIQVEDSTKIVNEKIVFNVESNFENVSILESCGLKQNELGLISQSPESSKTCKAAVGTERQIILDEETQPISEKDPRCQLCGFTFPDQHILVLHKQLVHSTQGNEVSERKQFGCYLCTKEFKMRGSLMVHLRVAHGGAKVAHVGTKEADVEVRQFLCNMCGKSFKKDQHLSQHMKTHEGKQWSCDVCHKMFTTKYFLKKHNRLHTGEMPYSCNVCSKTFTFQQSMHKHALYHRDDKPHQCSECNRSFKELSTLHNHRRIHTGEKPFSCETCDVCCMTPTVLTVVLVCAV